MAVVTKHIRDMLTAASDLAERAERGDFTADRLPAALERSANLASHAAEELRDEMLRARDGWAFV